MTSYAVCILAGGQATRLPRKLERHIAGTPLLARVYANVRGEFPVYLAANGSFSPELDATFECPVVIDRWPGRGPLGGLLSAFGEMREDRAFVVAGDAPGVGRAALHALRAAWRAGDGAVVAESSGKLEPLVALYDRRAFLEAAWPVFKTSASVADVARALHARTVPLPAATVHNVNTPADFEVVT